MAIGDIAAGAGMALVDGAVVQAKDIDTEINRSRDYIVTHGKPGAGGVTTAMLADKAVTTPKLADKAVTTAKLADAAVGTTQLVDGSVALAKLAVDSVDSSKIKANAVGTSEIANAAVGTTQLAENLGLHNISAKHGVRVLFSDAIEAAKITLSGHLYIPNATTVTTSYVAAYINSDGRLGKTPSTRRYKRAIRNAPGGLFEKVLQLRPRLFKWRKEVDPSDHDELGLIAEEVAELVPWLVVTDEKGRPEAVRYEMLGLALLPVVQDLARRVAELEARP